MILAGRKKDRRILTGGESQKLMADRKQMPVCLLFTIDRQIGIIMDIKIVIFTHRGMDRF